MYLYEHFWPGLVFAGVLLIIFFWSNQFRLGKIRIWQWLLVGVIALCSVGLDYYVQTDNEKISAVITKIVRAAQNEDIEAIGKCVTDDYRDSFNENKITFLDNANARLSPNIIEKNVLSVITVDIHIPSASSIFTVRVMFDPRGPVYDFQKQMIFKLEARLNKQPDNRWLINRLELVEADMHPVNWQNIVNMLGEAFD